MVSLLGRWTHLMINDNDDNGLAETRHLLRSPANAAHLLASIADADAGRFVTFDLIGNPAGEDEAKPR